MPEASLQASREGDGMSEYKGPERIWLQDDESNPEYPGRTWCQDRVGEHDVEYVRADLVKEEIEDAWKDGYAKGTEIHSDYGWRENRDAELRDDCFRVSGYDSTEVTE